MAIVGDRRKRFQKEIDRLETRQDTAAKMVYIYIYAHTISEHQIIGSRSLSTLLYSTKILMWEIWLFLTVFDLTVKATSIKFFVELKLIGDKYMAFHQNLSQSKLSAMW